MAILIGDRSSIFFLPSSPTDTTTYWTPVKQVSAFKFLASAFQNLFLIKTLYIVRHAKSSWADSGMSDFERPLNERGLHDAPLMAKRFAERKEPVDLLVSSPAARAFATAHAFASSLGEKPIQQEQQLYLADVRRLMSIINKLPDAARQVMLFGHNPGLSDLVEHLTHNGPGDLPTCTVVRVDLNAESWKEIGPRTGHLAWWESPKGGN